MGKILKYRRNGWDAAENVIAPAIREAQRHDWITSADALAGRLALRLNDAGLKIVPMTQKEKADFEAWGDTIK